MLAVVRRHAQTEGNLRGWYQGRTDLPLAPDGVLLARRLGPEPWAGRVHVSPLRRARETAALLYPHAMFVVDPGLAEMDFGRFEAKSHAELKDDPAYQTWLGTMCAGDCPDGESGDAFFERARNAFAGIAAAEKERKETEVHIVAHGGVVMAIMNGFVQPRRAYHEWHVGYCGGYVIESVDDDVTRWRLVRTLATEAQ